MHQSTIAHLCWGKSEEINLAVTSPISHESFTEITVETHYKVCAHHHHHHHGVGVRAFQGSGLKTKWANLLDPVTSFTFPPPSLQTLI